ncbi:hypothetical protein [Alicyclobacillus dauci]|uniref:Uncharacterized protein n=1 Tax=Alicyclobacillus dauci TaxID=1475485 RepID=A0ABY6Z0P0_9BACL|nr:hypothetical protein [Alicyclobacillus dauci]WAH36407.1 hypothetical protein NZD86_19635 [Alicyclobacillus dauci]
MASKALSTFRRKMTNPLNWRKANQVLVKYSKAELATERGAGRLIEELAEKVGVDLSAEERKEAAKWLVGQGMDPQSKRDRMSIWKQVK